jgi:Nucleotidyl transferase AbiEii toxin, Type IV TA system
MLQSGGGVLAAELELALVREALQTRLLVELMSNAMHKELVLKGGMGMRAVHGSVRYTKDIDLDADERASKERIQGVVRRSIERAVSSGLIANAVVTAPMHPTLEVSRRREWLKAMWSRHLSTSRSTGPGAMCGCRCWTRSTSL